MKIALNRIKLRPFVEAFETTQQVTLAEASAEIARTPADPARTERPADTAARQHKLQADLNKKIGDLRKETVQVEGIRPIDQAELQLSDNPRITAEVIEQLYPILEVVG